MVMSHFTALIKRKEVVKMTIFIKVKKIADRLGKEKADLNWIGSTPFYTKDSVKDIRITASGCLSGKNGNLNQERDDQLSIDGNLNEICYPEGYGYYMEEQLEKELYF
jgi:hypothetical protein